MNRPWVGYEINNRGRQLRRRQVLCGLQPQIGVSRREDVRRRGAAARISGTAEVG